jgi:hypothetical protein
MVISPRGLLSDVGQRFSDTARSALPSVAEPSWFAPPVDVRGDGHGLTILFRVPESAMKLRAESTGTSVVLRARLPAKDGGWRAHHGVRVFALPFEVPRGSLRVLRKGPFVQVHVRRFHPDARKVSTTTEVTEPSA